MKTEKTIPLSPFHCPIALRRLTRAEFDQMSHRVMAHVFASQNELGRLCDEAVYQNDIALRLEAAGLGPVAKEVPITVGWRDFTRTFYLDLVVQEALICELKTVAMLLREHESQLLHYLLLLDLPHGKLINLRPASVEYRTVNAAISVRERYRFTVAADHFQPRTPRCRELRDLLHELLGAWGAFLNCNLYEEALVHFLGGESRVRQRVPLSRGGFPLGSQPVTLLTDNVAFRVTALAPDGSEGYASQLRRFLALTPLAALHWINLHHHDIRPVTIAQ